MIKVTLEKLMVFFNKRKYTTNQSKRLFLKTATEIG